MAQHRMSKQPSHPASNVRDQVIYPAKFRDKKSWVNNSDIKCYKAKVKEKKNTAKLRGFGYPRSSKLHTRCIRIKRCPGITDDTEDIQNDAQSITCDEETSTWSTKHHVRCTSIKYHLCKRKMTLIIPSDEPNMNTAYPDPKSNTCNRNRDIRAEHQVPTAKYINTEPKL